MGLPSFIIPIMGKSSTPAYNPLTTAWIAATLETDTTIINALNTFEGGLISNSLIAKFNALYPFVGGTSGKHSYNFIDTTQFQLTFFGSWTHSATGSVGNGSNTHADTGLIPSTTLSLNDTHLSVYTRNNTNVGIDIGAANTVPTKTIFIAARTAGNAIGNINQVANSLVANANSQGHFMASRTAATVNDVYKNGSSILASTVASTSQPTVSIYLGARHLNATLDGRTTRQLAFASIGSGLTSGEISTLYTLIQTFQTSLSRQV